mmetsp:Transcript_751/g.2242  ORF Transcript_751/g.2242 Transcript_751/m.2242 type:complete len:93 (+) Transcript_751:378-656(+)
MDIASDLLHLGTETPEPSNPYPRTRGHAAAELTGGSVEVRESAGLSRASSRDDKRARLAADVKEVPPPHVILLVNTRARNLRPTDFVEFVTT